MSAILLSQHFPSNSEDIAAEDFADVVVGITSLYHADREQREVRPRRALEHALLTPLGALHGVVDLPQCLPAWAVARSCRYLGVFFLSAAANVRVDPCQWSRDRRRRFAPRGRCGRAWHRCSRCPPIKAGTLVMPTVPPLSAIARITSSGLQRWWWFRAAQAEWLATIGFCDTSAASRQVCQPEWATSAITPTLFISAITARPKSLKPALAGSAQPSPIGLRRL